MGLYDPFRYLKPKLWPKKGPGVKLSIWLLTTKGRELPWFSYIQVTCQMSLESSWWKIQLCFRSHLNQTSTQKVMGPKIARVLTSRILGVSQVGSPMTKWHLGASLVARHIEQYKGEGGGFPPKFELWWVLWVRVARDSSVHQKCSNYTLTNLLFGLCKSVWIIDSFVICPSPHPGVPARPSITKVL
jgi:hypothetical protein